MTINLNDLKTRILSPEQYAYSSFILPCKKINKTTPFVNQALDFWASQPFNVIWGGLMYYPSPWLSHRLSITSVQHNIFNNKTDPTNLSKHLFNSKSEFNELCYFFRFYLYMADWTISSKILAQVEEKAFLPAEKLESCYLRALNNHVLKTPELELDYSLRKLYVDLCKHQDEGNPDCHEFRLISLYFHASLLLIAHLHILNLDKNSESYLINKAHYYVRKLTENVEHINFSKLAEVRLHRQLGLFALHKKKWNEALLELEIALSKIDTLLTIFINEDFSFLFQETKLRILEAFYRIASLKADYKLALNWIKLARKIDPICPYLGLKEALTLIVIGDLYQAKLVLQQIEPIAVVEKDYINYLLIKLHTYELDTLDIEKLWGSKTFFCSEQLKNFSIKSDGDFRQFVFSEIDFDITTKNKETPKLNQINFTKLPYDEIKKNFLSEKSFDSILKESLTYNQHESFWTLKSPISQKPYINFVPVIAFETYNQTPLPWFETLYLQRSFVSGTRKQLLFSINSHIPWNNELLAKEERFLTFTHFSKEINSLRDAFINVHKLSILKKSYLARLLASLGFQEEAIKLLDPFVLFKCKFLEEAYLAYTHVYISFLQSHSPIILNHRLTEICHSLPQKTEALRLRLNCAVLGTIIAGRNKNYHNSLFWREMALNVLSDIQGVKEFSEVETQLLISRTYRAVSYAPWIKGDKTILLEDAKICESAGRKALLLACTEKTALLTKENKYPMLETLSRIYESLGNQEKALKLMEELCYEVDPLDAKTHLQLGDLLEKENRFAEAYKHFLIAANLGGTHVAISWFRSGIMAEKLGKIENAERFYLNSWRFNPLGISPLKRLLKLNASKNSVIKSWALELIRAQMSR